METRAETRICKRKSQYQSSSDIALLINIRFCFRMADSLRIRRTPRSWKRGLKRGIAGKKEWIFSGRPVHVVSEAVSNEERSLFPSPGYPRLGYRRTKGRHTIGSYHHCSSCVSRARAETPKWVNTNNYAACASAHTREFFLIPLHRYTSIPTPYPRLIR